MKKSFVNQIVKLNYARLNLSGIYYDKGRCIGSDGNTLFAVKETYEPAKEGQIISPDGKLTLIGVKYPDYEDVLQRAKSGVNQRVNLDYDAIKEANKQEELHYLCHIGKSYVKVQFAVLLADFCKTYDAEVYTREDDNDGSLCLVYATNGESEFVATPLLVTDPATCEYPIYECSAKVMPLSCPII